MSRVDINEVVRGGVTEMRDDLREDILDAVSVLYDRLQVTDTAEAAIGTLLELLRAKWS